MTEILSFLAILYMGLAGFYALSKFPDVWMGRLHMHWSERFFSISAIADLVFLAFYGLVWPGVALYQGLQENG